jgi:hypothetical protein
VKFTLDQRSHLANLLDGISGESDLGPVEQHYADYLREQAATGDLGQVIDDLAHAAVTNATRARSWDVSDGQAGQLFDPGALLSLGDRIVIPMADARGEHVARHLQVLGRNFQAQSQAYHLKAEYLTDRLPHLYQRDCTLGAYEADAGLSDAA